MNPKEIIARRIAKEFKDGDVINLGFGIPNQAQNFIPEGMDIILQTENGALRFGKSPTKETFAAEYANSGGGPVTLLPGASVFDIQTSFAYIRGGHVDITVIGALEVDQHGSIANWTIPGVFSPGMGGAMDLLAGSKYSIAALQQTDKHGNSKLLSECQLPLTAPKALSRIITDMAVFDIEDEKFKLIEVAPGVTVEEVLAKTAGEVVVSDTVVEMDI